MANLGSYEASLGCVKHPAKGAAGSEQGSDAEYLQRLERRKAKQAARKTAMAARR